MRGLANETQYCSLSHGRIANRQIIADAQDAEAIRTQPFVTRSVLRLLLKRIM